MKQLAEFEFNGGDGQMRGVRAKLRAVNRPALLERVYRRCGAGPAGSHGQRVVRHEYAGDERGRMSLRVDRDGNALIFRLADYAAQVDCNSLRSRSLDELRPGGLGVHIIGSIMDQWQFVPPAGGEGNVLEMVKNVTNGNRGDSR